MRGRLPSGPDFIDRVPGSELAKNRARVLLQTIAGTCRVQEACACLGISEPRFDQLRIHGVAQLVQSMEPRPAGRPPRLTSPVEEQIRELQHKVAALEMQVKIAQTRAEIALVLPNAVHNGAHDVPDTLVPETLVAETLVADNGSVAASAAPEKKTSQPPQRRPRRPRTRAPASRKPT